MEGAAFVLEVCGGCVQGGKGFLLLAFRDILRPVDGMVREECGPVVDAVVGYEATHCHGLVGLRLGQGKRGGEAGAEIGPVDIYVSAG